MQESFDIASLKSPASGVRRLAGSTNPLLAEKRRSVLLVGTFLSSTVGTRSVCEDLAVHLTRSGWSVFDTSDKPNRVARLADMMGTVWQRRRDYAVAHVDVYSGKAFAWAEMICWTLRRLGKPYVLTLHGGNLSAFAARWPRRVKALLNSAEAVTAPSTYLLNQMMRYREDLCLYPNPLNLISYTFRQRNNMAPKLIWLRAFHQIYNPILAPQALAEILKSFPSAHLTMIGPDKGDGSLEQTRKKAWELGVASHITFVGSIPKSAVGAWLNKADIFLNTTNVDNTPVSVLEAMASGLCVISTRVGGISSLLNDENDALLVPPSDPEAMSFAIKRVLIDQRLATKLSVNGRRKVERFDWSIVLPKWEQLLNSIVEKSVVSNGRCGTQRQEVG